MCNYTYSECKTCLNWQELYVHFYSNVKTLRLVGAQKQLQLYVKEDIDKREGTLKHVQVQDLPFTSCMLAVTYLLQRRLGQSKNKKVKG